MDNLLDNIESVLINVIYPKSLRTIIYALLLLYLSDIPMGLKPDFYYLTEQTFNEGRDGLLENLLTNQLVVSQIVDWSSCQQQTKS